MGLLRPPTCIRRSDQSVCADAVYGAGDGWVWAQRYACEFVATFEVDRYYIAYATMDALAKEGKMTGKDVSRAIKLYKIDVEKGNPVGT